MHITYQKICFDIFTVGILLNIFMEHDFNNLMIFGIKRYTFFLGGGNICAIKKIKFSILIYFKIQFIPVMHYSNPSVSLTFYSSKKS